MKTPSPILAAVAARYRRSQAGRTGAAQRDVLWLLEELLAEAGCSEGEKRALAEHQLTEAEAAGILTRVPFHKRDPGHIRQIRFSPEKEVALYEYLGNESPNQIRGKVAEQFAKAAGFAVPKQWQKQWVDWCHRMQRTVLAGGTITPFEREPTLANDELLALIPKLLSWEGESLVRFASCVICHHSKRLEELAPLEREGEFSGQLRGKLGRLLQDITGGEIRALDDLGIVANPRSVLFHGPLKLQLGGAWVDFGLMHGPTRLSQTDVKRAEAIESSARRCLTVENETTFHELAKLQSGEVLVCTSYPGSATVALLRKLPNQLEFWHFGDSDQAGFDILRVIREKTGREFRPLHMEIGRIPFEQESLGRPPLRFWPFYPVAEQ